MSVMQYSSGHMNLRPWRALLIGSLALCHSAFCQAEFNVQAGASNSLPSGGSLGLGCNAALIQGSLDVGSSQLTGSGNFTIGSSGLVNGGSGFISLSGNWSNSGTFVPGSGTVTLTDTCSTGPFVISGNTVFNNLTLSSSSGSNFVVQAGSNITVNGTLNLQGSPQNPISVTSSDGQVVTISLGPQAQVIKNNVNVNPAVVIGAASGNPQDIPTLSEYALLLLMLLVTGVAGRHLTQFPRSGPTRSVSRKSID